MINKIRAALGLPQKYHWWCFTVIENGKNVLYWVGMEKRNISRPTLLRITGGHTTIINSLYLGKMTEKESSVMDGQSTTSETWVGGIMFLSNGSRRTARV